MLSLALTVWLAAAPPSMAMGGLNAVRLDTGEGELYAELLAQKLTERGFKVLTTRDVSALLGFERQRQLLGCSDDQSCLAELSGALGVDLLLLGDIAMLDGQYTIALKVLTARDGAVAARFTSHADSARQMPDELARAGLELTQQLSVALQRPDLMPARPAEPTLRRWALLPGLVGIAFIGAGVGLEVQARRLFEQTRQGIDVDGSAATGATLESLGYAALGVGSAAVVTAVVLFVLGGSSSTVTPTASLTPHGATFGLTGALP